MLQRMVYIIIGLKNNNCTKHSDSENIAKYIQNQGTYSSPIFISNSGFVASEMRLVIDCRTGMAFGLWRNCGLPLI